MQETTFDIDIDINEVTGVREESRRATLELVLEDSRWRVRDADRGVDDFTLAEVHHGLVWVYTLAEVQGSAVFDTNAVRDFVGRHKDLLATIAVGYDTKWDGENTVGTLTTEAAVEGQGQLKAAIDEANFTTGLAVWELEDWLCDGSEDWKDPTVSPLTIEEIEWALQDARTSDRIVVNASAAQVLEALESMRKEAPSQR